MYELADRSLCVRDGHFSPPTASLHAYVLALTEI